MNASHTILIVDDDSFLRKTLADILESKGYIPLEASSASQGLQIVEDSHPDLCLIDLILDDMSGIQLLKKIKESTDLIECIILTGYATQASAIKSVNLGAYSYVQKPFDIDQLLLTIRRALEKLESEKSLRRSEERFRTLFEEANDAIILETVDNRIFDVNNLACSLTGYKRTELLQMKTSHLESDETHSKPSKRPSHFESVLIHKNGKKIPVDITLAPLPQGERELYLSIIRDITQRKQVEERLQYLATHDPLTELPNRELFNDRLIHSLSLAKRNDRHVAVLFMDLDGFKSVNDQFGHEKGDQFLKVIANRLEGCIRESDTVARLGGDEFTFILENIDDEENVVTVVDKILTSISKPYTFEDHKIKISASIGISLHPHDGDDPQTLVKSADLAMYSAKQSGKSRYMFASQHTNNRKSK